MIGGIATKLVGAFAKIGNIVSGNYFEIEADGTDVRHGDATMWDDITGSLVARRLESTLGRLQYNLAENTITMQDDGSITKTADRLIFNFQKPHAAKADSEMRLHIHWEQTNSDKVEFVTQYRIQNNGAAKTTAWTTVNRDSDANSVFTYTSGTLNQITRLAEIDLSSAAISSTVQFRLARVDDNGFDDIEASFVDAHLEFDMLGSRSEYSKQ